MKRNYLDFWQFMNIMRELDIDTKYLADKIYDKKFGNISKYICCICKIPFRWYRNKTIKDNIITEKFNLDQDVDFD